MILSLIAAMSENRIIGKDNQLPWHYPTDLKRFKNITYGSPIIMGRNTYESIGKPLPGRRNIVISRSTDFPKVEHYTSPDTAIARLEDDLDKEDKVFVIGGASLYEYFLEDAQYIYMTHIHKVYSGDRYFPFFEEHFEEIEREDYSDELSFSVYRKNWTETEE